MSGPDRRADRSLHWSGYPTGRAVADVGNYQGGRFLAAAEAAFAELGEQGFRVREPCLESWRRVEAVVSGPIAGTPLVVPAEG